MANSQIYNIRFYRKDAADITSEDYESIYSILLDEKKYENRKPVSWNTPFIFEIDQASRFIELLIEPYKNYEFHSFLSDLAESNRYYIWSRWIDDGTCINNIYELTEPEEEIQRKCVYRYDEVIITTRNKKVHNYFKSSSDSDTIHYKKAGQYHSCLPTGFNDLENKTPFEYKNRSKLSDKLNWELFKFTKMIDCSGWYSDKKIAQFIKMIPNESDISEIKFLYQQRLVRWYNNSETTSCLMLDDWDNCVDDGFLNFLKRIEKNKTLA